MLLVEVREDNTELLKLTGTEFVLASKLLVDVVEGQIAPDVRIAASTPTDEKSS